MSTPDQPVRKRKLIEVALPLETINRESAREKSIRHGHPSTLHLWWARRPLAAARAVLFAQLVDDPSSRPGEFPTEAEQNAERERLHKLIERLVLWENTRDRDLLDEARREILKSTDADPPPILDPFAGGGTIPLEAQRLGLETHASDLNPVAVLINKALVEIPPKVAGQPPVFPGLAEGRISSWEGATGLAADVRAYGEWMRNEAEKRIGQHYPRAVLDDGTEATVIAWKWARTVTCPNPACGIEMPLVRTWWLGKKKGKEVWVRPTVVADPTHASGKRIEYEIESGVAGAPATGEDGTMDGRRGGLCVACGSVATIEHVRIEGAAGRMDAALMAVVVEGPRQRLYVAPDEEHARAATVARPDESVDGTLSTNPRWFSPPSYGLTEFADLFTNRQLLALTTFSDLVTEARERVLADVLDASARLQAGGTDAKAYADAVATYLAFGVDKLALTNVTLATWQTNPERLTQAYSRQAVPMTWDFAEANPLSRAGGGYGLTANAMAKVLERVPTASPAEVIQADAATRSYKAVLINTDPPYYDNIGYSDLSDYFYVWLRRALREVYPDLLSTMLVPKAEELVANPHRHDGKSGAREFFENGFRQIFSRARQTAMTDYPIVVWYAFKQSDSLDGDVASTGWETLLESMIKSGWEITSTWPVRSELVTSLKASVGALASSIVLTLRPRPESAVTLDRRGLLAALHDELPEALRNLQQGAIAPVDLPQAAIGPGMAVFSRYAKVIENDGAPMTVRSALARINEILDQVLVEQEGDFDPATRFAIAWYRQHGYAAGKFGDADNLARARNTAVETLARAGILVSLAGKVTLVAPAELPEEYDVLTDDSVGVWEVLHHLITFLSRDGVPAAGLFLADARGRPEIDLELVKELAFLLFSIAERNGWTQDAIAFNQVATSWPEIIEASRAAKTSNSQSEFDFEED